MEMGYSPFPGKMDTPSSHPTPTPFGTSIFTPKALDLGASSSASINVTSVKQHASELERLRHKIYLQNTIQISLQTAEAALEFRFDHFIVTHMITNRSSA